MTIYRHPDGSFHRFPYRDLPEDLTPILGSPGWFIDKRTGARVYREPNPNQPDGKPPDICLTN